MTRARIVALGGLIVLLLPATARPTDRSTVTIRLISTTIDVRVLRDRAPIREDSKGDVVVLRSTLRNAVAQLGRPKGAVVGHDTVVFTILTPNRRADMTVQSELPGGRLLAGGIVRLGRRQTYPVTGGSGRFANAHGTGETVALGVSGDRRSKVYRLVLR
jgi:hypothetical protein